MKIEFTSDRLERFDGWARRCRVGGVEYQVSVRRGKRVRIAFKPRGQNWGFHYDGTVYADGRRLWSDRVPGSIGVRGLLLRAGVKGE